VSDIAAVLALANELHDLPPNPILRHEWMLAGLRRILGAAAGVSMLLQPETDVGPRRGAARSGHALLMLIYGGWESDPRAVELANAHFRSAGNATRESDPAWAEATSRLVRESRDPSRRHHVELRPIVHARRQLVDDGRRSRSTFPSGTHGALKLGDELISLMLLPSTGVGTRRMLISALRLFRSVDMKEPFGEREQTLLRLFHSQAAWLFRAPLRTAHDPPDAANGIDLIHLARRAGPRAPTAHMLSPRQRQTLRLLLGGDSEKQIASKLSVSRHTVHEHVKAIYRNTGVSSRGELFARFLSRKIGAARRFGGPAVAPLSVQS
jgi:DNA-binding CsgD family transcriptional regulator